MSVSVIEVKELAGGRTFGESEDGSRRYERKYLVRLDTSSATSGEAAAVESHVEAALPFHRYDQHPACPWVYCKAIQCEQVVGPNTGSGAESIWTVTATYSSQQARAGSGAAALPTGTGGDRPKPDGSHEQSADADERLPQVKLTRKERKKVLEKDEAGADVKNTAGDPFDPPIEVDRSYQLIDITFWKYPEDTDFSALHDFYDRVNSDPMTFLGVTYGSNTLKLVNLEVDLVWDKGKDTGGQPITTLFVQHHVVFEYNPDEWTVKVLNAGMREKKGGVLVPVNDPRTGQPVNNPAPLKADGSACGPSDAKVYLDFAGYQASDFSGLF